MGIGKSIYKYFYKPTSQIRYNLAHFGLEESKNLILGELTMKKQVVKLPPIHLVNNASSLNINFLTGQKYWHQPIFCIQSLIQQIGNQLSVHIYSDGTLSEKIAGHFKNYCPQITIVSEEEILEQLNAIIPADKYPSLNFLRNWHPFFRRVIDIHCKLQWGLHLDSDMLFFKYPTELINCQVGKNAFFMQEQMGISFFVDEKDTLSNKFDMPTIENVNGGIIGYDGSMVDYERLENIARLLIENYLKQGAARMEQTLMSYILSTQNAIPLNKDDYKIYYDNIMDDNDDAVLRHYIFKAKLPYFSAEWKKIVH